MEIARLEVFTQQHLDRIQEAAKVNYVQYGKSTKSKKGKKSTQSGASGSSHRGDRGHGMSSKPSGKGRKLPFPQDTCYRCGKGRHQKVQDCKALDTVCRGCGKKGHFEKVCLKKHSTHSLEVTQASTSTAGAGAGEPLYFDNEGQPVYTYMVSVPHVNKHLIKFPIALDYSTLRGRNKMEYSTCSTGHSNCSTVHSSQQSVLLKADTGSDVNLMNRKTFNQLFGEAKVLQPTPIRMENYGNTAVKVLGMFHAFLRWKDKVYKQLFYMTDCDRSPNFLSRDACYALGVLKPCYTVENSTDSTDSTHASNKGDLVAKSFLHQKMKESERKPSNCSNKWSISERQLQGSPLKKQDILDIYSDIFTRIGKFPGMPYKFQLKPNAKPARHAPRKVPIHLQDAFHEEIRNLEALGILEETKDVTERVNSFVIMEIVRRLPNSSTHMVIKELGLVFTELGRPFILRSDNGPCYSSREFHNFLSFYQVDHITSSPHYPQNNGFAEALVGITKKLMEKSVKEGKLWNYGLMQYRTTPISSTLPSPLEMLTGRRPHSTLPQLPSSIGKNIETSRI